MRDNGTMFFNLMAAVVWQYDNVTAFFSSFFFQLSTVFIFSQRAIHTIEIMRVANDLPFVLIDV